jgi:uncharacterized protein YajQ (UPF0234 family)
MRLIMLFREPRGRFRRVIKADDDFKLKQVQELLRGHLARRKLDAGAFEFGRPEKASGNTLRQEETVLGVRL